MNVIWNSKRDDRLKLRRRGMPTEPQVAADLRRLVAEARHLTRRARELDLAEAKQAAVQRLYGQVTASTKVSFACQNILAREIRDWLRRAELAARTATIKRNVTGTQSADLLVQLSGLIDSANVAMMRGFKSPHAWSDFCSATDGATTPAAVPDRCLAHLGPRPR
jgi:hypothetical protein